MNIEKEFKDFLSKWVEEHSGVLDIDTLAHDLRNEFYKIKDAQELDDIADDVKYVAEENMGIDLDDKDAYAVAQKYRFSDAYCSLDRDSIEYYIRHYKGEC